MTQPTIQRVRHLLGVKRYDEARDLAARALAGDPDSVELHTLLVQAHLGLGDAATAREHAFRVVALAPDRAGAHLLAARASFAAGDAFTAREASREAVRLAPHAPEAFVMLAQSAARLAPGHPEAHNAAVRAVDLAPNSADAHFAAGYALSAAGNKALARKAYRKALEIDPTYAAAMNNLGNLEGTRAGAARSYQAALSLDPQNSSARSNLERIAHRLAFELWCTGALVWLVGSILTVTHGSLEHSAPGLASMLVGVALPVAFGVRVRSVVRQLPSGIARHLARLTSNTLRRATLTALALGMLALGEVACWVPGGGTLGLSTVVFWTVVASGFFQLFNRFQAL